MNKHLKDVDNYVTKLDEFVFDLPEELIAQSPLPGRSQSRLLYLDGGSAQTEDMQFTALPALLRGGDLLLFNDTRVIPGRIFGKKSSGGKIEILIERIANSRNALAQIRASKAPKVGSQLILSDGTSVMINGRTGEFYKLQLPEGRTIDELLHTIGEIPLPPYIDRPANDDDRERYQTIFARRNGAVAAPTAGLHFDQPLLDEIARLGVEMDYVTLHVGAGTFQPVRTANIHDHVMHSEYVEVSAQVCEKVHAARRSGGRVIAVGTTVARSLEAASCTGVLAPFSGETDIFIYPGYQFASVDALITNFHLPGSTLLMLVCAFAGKDNIFSAYRHAIESRYRFFSYGDAMFMTPVVKAINN